MALQSFDISQMLDLRLYEHAVSRIELIETHISWVVLTGEYAYKVKKPVDFGFLDFSTLEKRREYCEQEIRLNRRLAPAIYLDVVDLNTHDGMLNMAGDGKTIEVAVRMRQFPQSAQLDRLLEQGALSAARIDAIADMIADFHGVIEIADASRPYGEPAAVLYPAGENFRQIAEHLDTDDYDSRLQALESWSAAEFGRRSQLMAGRKQDGFVRHCHGDMHLRNMLWLDRGTPGFDAPGCEAWGPMAFDCIEFNPNLSWIDVMSELAFLVMDLEDRGQASLANRCLNRYLQHTGDYGGLGVFDFYLCYRAMVRAKVSVLQLEQVTETDQRRQMLEEFEAYLALAESYTRRAPPRMIIMHGLSASGKSTLSQMLLDNSDAIRIRSDVERKRLFGIAVDDDAGTGIEAGIYTGEASNRTYARCLELALAIIDAGRTVIVDAAFLQAGQRQPFFEAAQRVRVPITIVDATAPHDVLRQRIIARTNDISDADIEVLEHQIRTCQPFSDSELGRVISVDTTCPVTADELIKRVFD